MFSALQTIAARSAPRTLVARFFTMASAAQVRAKLRVLLQGADMQNTTERQLRDALAAELGPIDNHKALIRDEVEAFLAAAEGGPEHPPAGADDDADFIPNEAEQDGEDEEEDEEGPSRKKKKAASGKAVASSPAARAGGAAASGQAYRLRLSDKPLKYLSVSTYKGRPQVDFREYYIDKGTGEHLPGQKGICLSIEQWAKLRGALPALAAALQRGDLSFEAALSNDRKAALSQWQGRTNVQVREYYDAGGEMKPGKKGLALDPQAFQLLVQHAEEVHAKAQQLAGQAPPSVSSSKAAGSPAQAPPTAAPAAAAAAGASASASGAAAGSAATPSAAAPAAANAPSSSGQDFIDLGGDRRVSVSTYQNRVLVDLREWYQKDGATLPGKKGISLPPADWQAVCAAADAISAAAAAKNTSYVQELSGSRRVTISEFKSKMYVAVREYYEKNGQMLPGQKGLNMAVDAWQRLLAGRHVIDAAVARLGGE